MFINQWRNRLLLDPNPDTGGGDSGDTGVITAPDPAKAGEVFEGEVLTFDENLPADPGIVEPKAPEGETPEEKSAREELEKWQASEAKAIEDQRKADEEAAKAKKLNTPVPHPDSLKAKRDYTGIDESDIPALKAMPNAAFAHIAPRLKSLTSELATAQGQLKELVDNSGIPPVYNEHPDAFQLFPEYKKVVEDHKYATYEVDHLTEQLDAVRALRDGSNVVVKNIVGYNNDGTPQFNDIVVSKENKAAIESGLIKALGKTEAGKDQLEAKARGIVDNHRKSHKSIAEFTRSQEDKYFSFYKDGEKSYTPEMQKFVKDFVGTQIAPALRTSLLARPLAKAALLITQLNGALKAEREKSAKLTNGSGGKVPRKVEQQLAGGTTHEIDDTSGEQGEILDNKGW